MSVTIIKTSEFDRQFEKLPLKIREKAAERLRIFVQDQFSPILNNHKLSGKHKDYRSLNVTGDYRIVYKEVGNSLCLLVDIGTHSELWG
jgi:addiction module RelE/StbE family toxin